MSDDATIRLIEKDAVREHIMRTARLLDEEALEDWLALFSEDGIYEIRAYGTEIRADMVWWRSTYAELAEILKEARDHVRDPARRLHLVSPVSVEISADRAEALSHFQITRTDPDGVSSIYVAGRYVDSLVKANGRWLYDCHRAVLDTRMLDSFTHLPL